MRELANGGSNFLEHQLCQSFKLWQSLRWKSDSWDC